MKWRVPGQEVDQRKLGERLWKKTVRHINWTGLMIRIGVSGWMFLLVPAHPGCPGQSTESRKTVVCLCVCVCVCVCSQTWHSYTFQFSSISAWGFWSYRHWNLTIPINLAIGFYNRLYYRASCDTKIPTLYGMCRCWWSKASVIMQAITVHIRLLSCP